MRYSVEWNRTENADLDVYILTEILRIPLSDPNDLDLVSEDFCSLQLTSKYKPFWVHFTHTVR